MEDTINANVTISGFTFTKVCLTPVGTPSFHEWQKCGSFINNAEKSVHFWIGDWLNYGEKNWKNRYEQAVKETGFEYGTLRNDKYVASRITASRRRDTISFGHYQELASLTLSQQDRLIEKVLHERLPLDRLRQEKRKMLLEETRVQPHKTNSNLFLGDCLTMLPTIPDNSIDLVLTDPPYGIEYESRHRSLQPFGAILNDTPEQAFTLLDQALALLEPKLKVNSHVYIFTSWKTYPQMMTLVEKYFQVKNLLVWEKNHWTQGDFEGNYGQVHEFILFAHKGRRHLNGSLDKSVLHFDRVAENGRSHPTEKPLPLLEFLITKSTNEQETVLDMFMGAGSTCVAAKNTKRKYIGIEIEKEWFDVATSRLT